ncbi:MAG: NUDIX domain-containing protein [Chloroflexota bacterium]|nr:NUDIX domain-containing protein [Chloroflexota bacterium]
MMYCPRCASPLEHRLNGGRDRPHCTNSECSFIFFGDFSIGCGGVVIRDGKALLVQRAHNPGKGSWQIPGGYVEADEEVAEAVVRECLEEAGVLTEVVDVLGFRHSIGGQGSIGGPSTNIYVVFRLRPLDGEPVADGIESAEAGFYSLEQIESMERVQGLSKWAIQRALECGPGLFAAHRAAQPGARSGATTGETPAGGVPATAEVRAAPRPGWSLFGVALPDGVEPVSVVGPPRPPTAT